MNALRCLSTSRRAALAAVAAVVLSGLARGDDPKVKPASKDDQRASGVIVKVDRARTQDGSEKLILSINTAAVWRDWARDQAAESPRQSARKDAREGAESVATKGEPKDKNTLVKVEVVHDSRIETRFRALDDESKKGDKAPGADTNNARRDSAKPPQFRMADLKPGLFVETDFGRKDEQNVARSLTVIRPTGPAAKAAK